MSLTDLTSFSFIHLDENSPSHFYHNLIMYSYFVLQGCISQLSEYFRRNVFILGLIAILLSAFQVSRKTENFMEKLSDQRMTIWLWINNYCV